VLATLTAVALALTAGYLAVDDLIFGAPVPVWSDLAGMLDVNGEGTVPTWFSQALWLLSSAGACLIALNADAYGGRGRHWLALACIFLLLSLDEGAQLHEHIGEILDQYVKGSGAFAWSWVLYGLAFLVDVAALFWRFVLSLPRLTAALFVLAAVTFVAGALGVEMYSAAIEQHEASFPPGLNWPRLLAIEELLEMLGVVLNLAAVMSVLVLNEDALVRLRWR
jgi:hypothetical protein